MREDNENAFTLDACGLSLLLSFILRFSGSVHNLSQGILMRSEANLSIAGGIWMNILIIGNGFDLAHGLPTTYKDFLKFTDKFEEYRLRNEDGDELLQENDGSSDYFFNLFGNKVNKNVRDLIQELNALIKNNVWIKYFKNLCESRKEQGKDGWIDFESEISHIIQTLDSASHTMQNKWHRDKRMEK